MKTKSIAATIFLAAFFLTSLFFSGCHSKKTESSFINSLDMVDALVSTGQNDEAIKLLSKIEKTAYSPYSRISVYKRYMLLGEEIRGEKVLINGLKKIPENLELSAVYSKFLLNNNKISDALKIAQPLKNSKYASIYSECFLKEKKLRSKNESPVKTYLADDMREIYEESFYATKDQRFLVNNALTFLLKGNYSQAVLLMDKIDEREIWKNPFFWALVNFDAEHYGTAISIFEKIILHDENKSDISAAEYLIADAYQFLEDDDASQNQRNAILDDLKIEKNKNVYLNSALWANRNNEKLFEYKMLTELVAKFPEYTEGLCAYGEFAIESNREPEVSEIEKKLREVSLKSGSKNFVTEKMYRYDEIPRIPITDPIFRIKTAISTQKDLKKELDYNLVVALKNLEHKIYFENNETARISDFWRTLEEYELGKSFYPSQIVHWAITNFLETGTPEHFYDAKSIFEPYIVSKYYSEGETSLPDYVVEIDIFGGERRVERKKSDFEKMTFFEKIAFDCERMELWECETAAFFAIRDKDISSALKIYNKISGKDDANLSINGAVNYAMILSCLGEKQRALALYGRAMGETKDNQIKADILYRMAKIQLENKDERSGILSLEYCISLDPSHASARLLLQKLMSER